MAIWSSEINELEKLYESFKGQLPELGKELERLIKTDDENIILVYARRCLEVIITDLCECELKRPRKTEPLQGIIDKLLKEEKVPSNIIASMHGLNELSTFGAHPKDFDPKQIRTTLINLETIIEWYLKHRKSGSVITVRPDEEIGQETKSTTKIRKSTIIPKKWLFGMISAIIAVFVTVFVVLYFSKIIGDGKHTKELDKSIAVIPFYNLSGDLAQDFMCQGLTNEIISHLFKIKSFDKVVSFSTSLTYLGNKKKPPEIADELKVNYILEGSYKKAGDQIKVTAQLIEAKKDRHIWLHEYDGSYKDLIAIQADIALQIASSLNTFLTNSERQIIQKIPTANLKAYEIAQQALNLWKTRRYKSFDQLIDLGKKAIELDPDFADVYAFLGLMNILKGSAVYGNIDMQSIAWDAASYFEKALELDPDNSQGHFGMALLNEFIRWDYIKADKEYLNAIETEPNNPDLLSGYTEYLIKMNRLDEVWHYLDTAEVSYRLLELQIFSGDKSEAYKSIEKYKESIGMDIWIGEIYTRLEEYNSAKLCLESERYIQSDSSRISSPRFQAVLALTYYKTNNNQKAQMIINQLIEKSKKTSPGSPEFFTGWYYSGIGKVDSAFYWLEEAFKRRSPEFPWLKVDPVFKNIKSDPRYRDLYARTGHKAYDEYYAGLKK